MTATKKPVTNKKPTTRKPRAKKPTVEVKANTGIVSHVSIETLVEDAPESERIALAPENIANERKHNGSRAAEIVMSHKELTEKERLFILEYVKDCNGNQAAIRAGYSPKTARQQASQLLTKLNVKLVVDEIHNDRAQRGVIDDDLLCSIWQSRIQADPNSITQYRRVACRFCYGEGFRYQMTPNEYENAVLEHQKMNEKRAKDDLPELPFDPKGGIGYNGTLDPNPECPECWGEGVGRLHIADTRKLSKDDLRLYAGAKKTKDGIIVELHSQPDAEEKAGRAIGLFKDKQEINIGNFDKDALEARFSEAIAVALAKQQKIKEERGMGD